MPSAENLAPKSPQSFGQSTALADTANRSNRYFLPARLDLVTVVSAALCLVYIYLFWASVSQWWFNPRWSTDDALQQVFPFHSVHHPEIFKGDFIAEVMRGYLAPLHWALGYALTWLCGDALLAAHYIMM